MAAVERCPVWRSLKSLNLRQREKLLAAVCMVIQETVEGNADRATVNCPEDFRNWGRRWGEDDSNAQLVMQNQWDNLLRHVMGITAAMKVWDPNTSSSSASRVTQTPGDNYVHEEQEGNGGDDDRSTVQTTTLRVNELASLTKGSISPRADSQLMCEFCLNCPLILSCCLDMIVLMAFTLLSDLGNQINVTRPCPKPRNEAHWLLLHSTFGTGTCRLLPKAIWQ